jgi:hypothetical protein
LLSKPALSVASGGFAKPTISVDISEFLGLMSCPLSTAKEFILSRAGKALRCVRSSARLRLELALRVPPDSDVEGFTAVAISVPLPIKLMSKPLFSPVITILP